MTRPPNAISTTGLTKPGKHSTVQERQQPVASRRVGDSLRNSSHIVAIHDTSGTLSGYQLRWKPGGSGNSRFFAAKKHGGSAEALRMANDHARSAGLEVAEGHRGGVQGRLLKSSKNQTAGIRFVWVAGEFLPLLRVFATWVDKTGKARCTSYSVERNGLDGALDKAIKARTSAGAPPVNREVLSRALKCVYRVGSNH